ncbi:MAG: substrate-binding domain-containing protein [Anaerolineaceae bacterium]
MTDIKPILGATMTSLGKYELHEQLGRGGFGTVYRAVDAALGREVALKVLHPQLTTDPDFLERFRNEARLVASLDSLNIVTIHDLDEKDGRVFIAMEYLPGGSLKQKLEKDGALSFNETLTIMKDVFSGLQEAHEQGLVHRDIKPANILFNKKGRAVIGDFGLARAVQNSSSSGSSSGGAVGTPAYRAPELWLGKPPASPATDIYSLGCVLSEMLSGNVLFDGSSTDVIITQHLVIGPSLPETFPEGVPAGIRPVLEKALAKNPLERFQTVSEFEMALDGLIAEPVPPGDAPEKPADEPKPPDSEIPGDSAQPQPAPPIKTGGDEAIDKIPLKKIWIGIVGLVIIGFAIWFSTTTILNSKNPSPTQTPALITKPVVTLASISELESGDDRLDIGIVLPDQNVQRWAADGVRFNEAIRTGGYRAEILYSKNESAVQRVNVDTLISKGIKVLILCPVDSDSAAGAAEAARAAGVKVISYDRMIKDTDAVDYYITFDGYSIGKAQAEYLVARAKATGATGLPLYLYAGAPYDSNSFLIFAGAWSVLSPRIADGTFVIKNSIEAISRQDKEVLTDDDASWIINQINTGWDYSTAQNLAYTNLAAVGAYDKGDVFILAPNDGTARAIADTFAADKDVKSYQITGQDAEKDSVQYIIDGKQSMTVFKDIRILVNDAFNTAAIFLKGDSPLISGSLYNGSIYVPISESEVVTVTRENFKEVLIDSGYYSITDFSGLN